MHQCSGRPKLLVVERPSETVHLTESLCDHFDIEAVHEVDPSLLAGESSPDLILLGTLPLPQKLKWPPLSENIPIVIALTAAELLQGVPGCGLPWADCVDKPYDPQQVKERLLLQLEIKRCRERLELLQLQQCCSAGNDQLQQELSQGEREQEELSRLVEELERALSAKKAALAAAEGALQKATAARCEAEEDAARLGAELQRQKLELERIALEFQSFSYSISHDLRAPLRHLMGFSSALLEDYREQLDGTAQVYLDCIAKAGRKIESLMDALLLLSRISRQEMRPTAINLTDMARECAIMLQESAPQRQVRFHISENLSARADASLMRVVFNHLLENAWKYTGKKESATIWVSSKEEEGGTVYFVRDDGAGFDMAYADRLFGAFQRLHRESEFEGTGVGLAAVQRIIHRHGGRIWAEAAIDGGATFYFTLSG